MLLMTGLQALRYSNENYSVGNTSCFLCVWRRKGGWGGCGRVDWGCQTDHNVRITLESSLGTFWIAKAGVSSCRQRTDKTAGMCRLMCLHWACQKVYFLKLRLNVTNTPY